ncbi:hypothetical protein OF829_12820 [Sphingomonas sp. LB-2]|uniref:hypothetical protein n=1 Tax=Sphingomonas caeni TaxID=2984949 RepID=UPI00222E2DB6|nr:hypothetical protein [Sphingomonas caeni]MCW3848126.1 hypothetical protein [Sphingomonas caeni]
MDRRGDNLADEWPPLRTITDLALRKWHVRLTCPDCKHVRVMSGAGMWYLFDRKRWPDDIPSARKRFYCSLCRCNRRVKIRPQIDKTHDTPTGPKLPDPSDYDWKKLIARYRS